MALASSEFQNCTVPRTVTSTEFYVNPDVGKILLVMMTSKKNFQRIVLQCGQIYTLIKTAQEISIPARKLHIFTLNFQKFWPNIPSFCWMILYLLDSYRPNSNHLLIFFVKNNKERVFLNLPLLTLILIYKKNEFPFT